MAAQINSKKITELAEQSESERSASLNYFATQCEEIKIEIMERHGSLIHQKNTIGGAITDEFSYSCLCLAVRQIRIKQSMLRHKVDLNKVSTEELSRQRIEGFNRSRKSKPKKALNRLRIEFFPLVCLLKHEHKYSYNQILNYLWTHHQYSPSRTSLITNFNLLLKETGYVK